MARRRRARRYGRAHMAWVRSFRRGRKGGSRRRRARRNFPVAGAVNPRRRRRSYRRRHYRMNPRRRRSYRRNPRSLSIAGFSLPPIQPVLYGFAGFVGTPFLEGTLSGFLPVMITSNLAGKYAVKVASVVGVTMLAKAVFGREAARYVAIGGGMYVAVSAARDFLPAGTIPGLNAYMPLGAYRRSLGAAPWGAVNSPASAGGGGAQFVASRFRRFQ
jgi:hypothetical protein